MIYGHIITYVKRPLPLNKKQRQLFVSVFIEVFRQFTSYLPLRQPLSQH